MVYSSYEFIFIFLPIVLVGYFLLQNLKSPKFQRVFLIIASLFFYGYNNVKYVPLIVSSVLINYLVARAIRHFETKEKHKLSKTFLALGIVFNVAVLGYYKYYNFFMENVSFVFNLEYSFKNIFLPLGISFFTFQQMSFLISIYKKEHKLGNLIDYFAFVTFFPQLVAGPIVLYDEIEPQFKDESRRKFNLQNFAKGLFMFALGMFKKVVIADTFAVFVDNGFGMTNMSLALSWATALSYTVQIYFDFSGYSDMAIGLGKMFNIDITYNFLSPYKSKNVSEFWRKWHITLGRALSTYIYRPLGGNRKGMARTCINLFLTFFVSGIWHGAAWTFVVWGVLYGLIVVFERLFKNTLERIPNILRITLTFLCVNALWVLFRAENFADAMEIYRGMVNFSNIGIKAIADIATDGIINFPAMVDVAYVLGLLFVSLFVVFKCKNSAYLYEKFSFSKMECAMTVIFFVVSILFMSRGSVFIYFNF